MAKFDQQWVEKRAYELWELDGRPEGQDLDHWYRASEEFLAISDAAEQTMTKARDGISVDGEDDILTPSPAKRRTRAAKDET